MNVIIFIAIILLGLCIFASGAFQMSPEQVWNKKMKVILLGLICGPLALIIAMTMILVSFFLLNLPNKLYTWLTK